MLLKTTWRLWYKEKVLRSMLTSLFHHGADLCRAILLSIRSQIPHCCSHIYLSEEEGREGGRIRNIKWVPPNVILRVSGSTVLWTNPLICMMDFFAPKWWVLSQKPARLSPKSRLSLVQRDKDLVILYKLRKSHPRDDAFIFLFNQLPPFFSVDNCWVSRSAFFLLSFTPSSLNLYSGQ